MNAKTIFKVVAFIFLVLFAFWLFWHVLGWLTLVAYTGGLLAICAAIAYGVFLLFFKQKNPAQPTIKQYKIWDTHTAHIYVFRNEPTLEDLVKLNDEMHMTKLELAGDVFQVRNETDVIILEDAGKEAVKIRIKGAKKKTADAEGWIGRSTLVWDSKQINGPKQ